MQAGQTLWEADKTFVWHIVTKFGSKSIDPEHLFLVGMQALGRAMELYEPAEGATFSICAYAWMWGSMLDCIDGGKMIRWAVGPACSRTRNLKSLI